MSSKDHYPDLETAHEDIWRRDPSNLTKYRYRYDISSKDWHVWLPRTRPTITPEMMDEARAALFAATPMHYTDRRIVEEPIPMQGRLEAEA
nr:hypothetical protein [uncultured Methanoregula sp.]